MPIPRLQTITASVVFALCTGAAVGRDAAAQDARPGEQQISTRFDAAMQAYDIQHFERAYADLSALADLGHAEAASVAWWMHRHARELYRLELHATPIQRQAWRTTIIDASLRRDAAMIAAHGTASVLSATAPWPDGCIDADALDRALAQAHGIARVERAASILR